MTSAHAARAIMACVGAGACGQAPAAETAAPALTVTLAPSAIVPSTLQGSAEPPRRASAASPEKEENPATPWQERCASELAGALRLATKQQPRLRGVGVKHEGIGDKESVFIAVYGPNFGTGNLDVRVNKTRGGFADAGAPLWNVFAEDLGGYHALYTRRAGDVDAGIGFGAWAPSDVEVLAPLFQSAIEHCDTR